MKSSMDLTLFEKRKEMTEVKKKRIRREGERKFAVTLI